MPLVTQVKFDEIMTDVSIQYRPATAEPFLADMVFPPVPVQKESAAYWVYDNSRFDAPDAKRAPRSEYGRIDWAPSTDTYLTEEYGLEGEIDDRERENAAAPLQLDVDTTEIVTDQILVAREKRVADIVTSASVVTQTVALTGTNQWSDGSSDPLTNVKDARQAIFDTTSHYPNVMLVGRKVYEALKLHPDIKEVVKYTERALITKQILAAVFDVDEVLVGAIRRRTSKEGQTDTFSDVWGNHALLFYREPRPGLKRASFGYQFRRTDLKVFRYREDKRNTDVIRVTEEGDEKVVSAALAYLIQNAAA